jgi:hypothetical protein
MVDGRIRGVGVMAQRQARLLGEEVDAPFGNDGKAMKRCGLLGPVSGLAAARIRTSAMRAPMILSRSCRSISPSLEQRIDLN